MAYDLNWINQRVREDAEGFLEECDRAYQDRVDSAAELIAKRLDQSPIVLLSGPSGSGKTTTAMKVEQALERRGINTHTISMDDYFLTVDPETAPRTETGEMDYESPRCLDMELLNQHFKLLSEGAEVCIPKFEFARQMRSDQLLRRLRLGKNEVAIFEGIHALSDAITVHNPQATRLYISARSDIEQNGEVLFKRTWLRLVRRTVRDANFRGSDAAFTLKHWANVRRGEKLYISPFKDSAHIMLDSSLPYEPCVMKNFAPPLFDAVPDDVQRHTEMAEVQKAFRHFEVLDPALVHPDSLIREFIGGGSYSY